MGPSDSVGRAPTLFPEEMVMLSFPRSNERCAMECTNPRVECSNRWGTISLTRCLFQTSRIPAKQEPTAQGRRTNSELRQSTTAGVEAQNSLPQGAEVSVSTKPSSIVQNFPKRIITSELFQRVVPSVPAASTYERILSYENVAWPQIDPGGIGSNNNQYASMR